jgi:hypothetical protein
MNKLIWQLFEMLREILPPTRENTQRLAEWAQRFHLEAGDPQAATEAPKAQESDEPPFDLDQEHELAELDDDDRPQASRSKRKRR